MLTVKLITSAEVKKFPMFPEYAAECANPVLGPPNPQWEAYEQIEAAGMLQAIGVYVDGDFAGFASVLLTINLHHGVKVATVESLFVGKQYRRTGAGPELLAAIKTCAGCAGCVAILYSAPAGSQLEELLGKRLARTNGVYCEALR